MTTDLTPVPEPELDLHHGFTNWTGGDPDPVGLPLTLDIHPNNTLTESILALQLHYLIGPLPPNFAVQFEQPRSELTVQISGPDQGEKHNRDLQQVLAARTGLEWSTNIAHVDWSNLDSSKSGESFVYYRANPGTPWFPTPIWLSQLGAQLHKHSTELLRAVVGRKRIHLYHATGSEAISPSVFNGIPHSRIHVSTVHLSNHALPVIRSSVILRDWQRAVAVEKASLQRRPK